MADPLIILGGGGHALSVTDAARRLGYEVIGFIAPEASPTTQNVIPRLGKTLPPTGDLPPCLLANGVGSAGPISNRRKVHQTGLASGYRFTRLLHPAASVSDLAMQIGDACQVMAGAVINAGVTLEDNVLINSGAIIEHDCRIGGHSHIASGATVCGNCTVADSVHVGAGATLIQGINIGFGAVIAAGAVVTADVEPLTLVAGVPAQKRRSINEQELA